MGILQGFNGCVGISMDNIWIIYGIILMGNGGFTLKDGDLNTEHGIQWFLTMGLP